MSTTIHATMHEAVRETPAAKRLVAWFWEGELIYVDVSHGMSPFDDYDVMGHTMESKIGDGFYRNVKILYGELNAEGTTSAKAHKLAADLLLAELKPRGARRKPKRPQDVVLTLSGAWPSDLPSQLGDSAQAPDTTDRDRIDAFSAEYCGGQTLPKALEALVLEHAEHGETLLMHPATMELTLGEVDNDDAEVLWFARGEGGARLGFHVAGGQPVAEAPIVLGDSEGGQRCVGRSIEEFVALFSSYDGDERVESARAWLAAHGLAMERTAEQIAADLPKLEG